MHVAHSLPFVEPIRQEPWPEEQGLHTATNPRIERKVVRKKFADKRAEGDVNVIILLPTVGAEVVEFAQRMPAVKATVRFSAYLQGVATVRQKAIYGISIVSVAIISPKPYLYPANYSPLSHGMTNFNSYLFCLLSFGILSMTASGCSSPQAPETDSPAAPASPTEPVAIQYAQGFTVDYGSPNPTLLIYGSTDTTRYVLLPANTPRPRNLAPTTPVIRTPVRRIVATSTTHLGLIEWLGARDHLVGIGQAALVYDEAIRQRVQQGKIQEVGTDGSLNVEVVLSLQPDLVMVSAMPGVGRAQYQPLLSAGIPVIVNAEWMEARPLGKAEWVKLMAVLLRQESYANKHFGAIAATYDSIVEQTRRVTKKPQVIIGSPFQGSWYIPGRDSYVGQLLRDAHVTWPWEQDMSAISFNVALETVYPYGLEADYWINPGMAQQLSALGEQDERLMAFRPYQRSAVYNHYRRVGPAGGNDYYEGGTVRADLVLADLVEIFHPEVLDHSLYYYQKLD